MDYSVKNHLHPYVYQDVKTVSESNIDWPRLNNKTVFVTGGSGFIAFYIICALLIRNDIYNSNTRVIALVRSYENAQKKYGLYVYLLILKLCFRMFAILSAAKELTLLFTPQVRQAPIILKTTRQVRLTLTSRVRQMCLNMPKGAKPKAR